MEFTFTNQIDLRLEPLMINRKIIQFLKCIMVLGLLISFTSCASLPGFRKGAVTYNDPSWCLPARLKRVLRQVAYRYGNVTVHSTHRTWWHNYKVGGARRSLHRRCRAADFTLAGNMQAPYQYVSRHPSVGGRKRYSSGHIHIDVGAKRSW